jgi:hypothetical protein
MNKENKYLIEQEITGREIYHINSDVPLTKGEILARIKTHKPDEADIDRGSHSPEITVVKGTLEEEYTRPVNVYPATEKGG